MSGKRIRSIKPEWLEDEGLAACSDTARMVSVAVILLSDDHGNGRAHPLYLASRIWPYGARDPRETLASLEGALGELVGMGFIRLYTVKNQAYYTVSNWAKHQRIDKPSKPLVPGPEHADGSDWARPKANGSRALHEALDTPSRDPRLGLGIGLGIGAGVGARAIPAPGAPEQGTSVTTATTTNGSSRVSPRAAAIAWQRALDQASPGSAHPFDMWQREFEVIATVCNAVEGKPELALRVVCEWFWSAPDGPIHAGRIARSIASPKHLAKHISRDLDGALQWWIARKPQPQPEPQGAAQ